MKRSRQRGDEARRRRVMRTSTVITWPARGVETPARVAAIVSSLGLGRQSSPTSSMRWSRWTRSSSPSTAPMQAKTAGQASPTSASGTACSSGSATASPRRVRGRAGDADVVGDQVGGPGGADACAVPSTTSGRLPPAVRASSAPIASVAASVEITGSRPLGDAGEVDAQLQVAPGEGDLQERGVVTVGHEAWRTCPRRRCSGLGTTRPAHTTSVRVERGVEQGGARTHGAAARGTRARRRRGAARSVDDRGLEPVEQVGDRLVHHGDATDGHRAGDDDHLVGAVGLVVGLPQRVGPPPAAYVGVDHGDEVDRLARAAADLEEELHVGGVQHAAGRPPGTPRRACRWRRPGPRGRRRGARSGRRSRGARAPGRGRAAPRSGCGR